MMIKSVIIILLLAASSLSGCVREEPAIELTKGVTTTESLVCDGLTRTYRLYIPSSYDRTPTPLVIVLHFGGGNSTIIETVTEMTEKAEEEGFIVVYPDGNGRLKDRFLTWNAGFCCGYALENNIDDVKFIYTLIEHFEKTLKIDASRIYVTGFCNGAALTYRVGAELSDVVAAIAPVAGSIGGKGTEGSWWMIPVPENPVSVIVFHGVHDGYILYEGGVTKSGAHVISVAESVSFWVEHNKCNPCCEKEVSESGNITQDTYSGGEEGTEVVLYTLLNGGHAWPGGKEFAGGDPPTQELSATDVIWEFFKEHPKTRKSLQENSLRTEFIDPVVTDAAITPLDELPDAEKRNLSHLVALNTQVGHPGILYVHLPGSGGLPEDYQYITACAASCGYHVVNLAYPNWPAVRILIRGNKDPILPEDIRRERLYGEDWTDIIDVSRADCVENRLIRLLQYNHRNYPEEGWDTFLTSDNRLRWECIVIGGHSQGAGHAAFLAKEHNLAGAIMFSGPGDFVTGLGPAPWLYYENVTPPDKMYAFTHHSDPVAEGLFANQRILGLAAFGLPQNVDGLSIDGLTSHMLTSTLQTDSENYHSCIILDEYLQFENGTPLYEFVWIYLFTHLMLLQ